jgi:hypothetical protein
MGLEHVGDGANGVMRGEVKGEAGAQSMCAKTNGGQMLSDSIQGDVMQSAPESRGTLS